MMNTGTIELARPGRLQALPPLALYVHIPWCVRKCPYCDFNSHQAKTELAEQVYVEALLRDLESELPHVWGRPVESIFIGGGTPSLFQAASIDQLLAGIRARIKVQPEAEITLEANPGTFEYERFAGYRAAGVNRLSIGVQSFQDTYLHALGRIHHGHEARTALTTARSLFPKVNADLMYALPGQTVQAALQDVQTALDIGVAHLSAYHLTLEPNTAFGHTPPPGLPEDEAAQDIEDAVHAALATAGLHHYETSAFARDGHRCQHNTHYWQFADYIGIGAGAHGKISYPDRIERTTRKRHPNDYLHAIASHGQAEHTRQAIAAADLPFEFMLNALRLHDGVPASWLPERTGVPLHRIQAALTRAQELGLLTSDPTRLQATALGRRFLNDLLQLFLPEQPS